MYIYMYLKYRLLCATVLFAESLGNLCKFTVLTKLTVDTARSRAKPTTRVSREDDSEVSSSQV